MTGFIEATERMTGRRELISIAAITSVSECSEGTCITASCGDQCLRFHCREDYRDIKASISKALTTTDH